MIFPFQCCFNWIHIVRIERVEQRILIKENNWKTCECIVFSRCLIKWFTWYPSQHGSELSIFSVRMIVFNESNPRREKEKGMNFCIRRECIISYHLNWPMMEDSMVQSLSESIHLLKEIEMMQLREQYGTILQG